MSGRRRGVAAVVAALLLLAGCEVDEAGVDPTVDEVLADADDARTRAATGATSAAGIGATGTGSTSTTRAGTATTRAAASPGERPATAGWTVTRIVDGDTVDVSGPGGVAETVRVAGIDTPERGECGYTEATRHMSSLTLGRAVVLTQADSDDRDRYGRIIRYIDVDGLDAGLAQITGGFAIARYDSRDGYGWHPREDEYIAADNATAHMCPGFGSTSGRGITGTTAAPTTGANGDVYYQNCAAVRAAKAAPLYRGQPGYRTALDGDKDGVACE